MCACVSVCLCVRACKNVCITFLAFIYLCEIVVVIVYDSMAIRTKKCQLKKKLIPWTEIHAVHCKIRFDYSNSICRSIINAFESNWTSQVWSTNNFLYSYVCCFFFDNILKTLIADFETEQWFCLFLPYEITIEKNLWRKRIAMTFFLRSLSPNFATRAFFTVLISGDMKHSLWIIENSVPFILSSY